MHVMPLATSPLTLAIQAERTPKTKLLHPPEWLRPRQIEREWAAALDAIMAQMAADVRQSIIPALPSIETQARLEQGRTDGQRADAWTDTVDQLIAGLRIGLDPRIETTRVKAIDIGQRTSLWNNKEWQKILRRTVGVGLLTEEPGLKTQLDLFVKTNANLITSLQADAIKNIQGKIERGFATGRRHTDIAKEIREEFQVSKSRARLIARDQVSKLNGRLTQMRQEQAGISKYIWQTSEDIRVRVTHNPMDGKVGRWDDASVYATISEPDKFLARSGINAVELHPGEDFQCRCFAEPFIRELEREEEAA